VAAISAISLLGATSAAAATEVGDNCAATSGATNYTMLQLARAPGSALPLTVPSSGIVTKWKVNSTIPSAFVQKLRVFRSTANPKAFQTVAESTDGTVVQGQNTFQTQIPVQAGDRFGVYAASPSAVLYCGTANAADEMGALSGNAAVGTTNEFPPVAGAQVAVSAIVEPDAVGDGFGDESQDKCPRSAALQAVECPTIAVSSFGLAKKGSALILASASAATNVSVSGTIAIKGKGKGGKKGKRAQASATIQIPGGSKAVADGGIVPFTLTFPPSLRSALAALPRSKSLILTATSTTTDLAGQVSTSSLKLKLKGQG
jgi:hypothetical protein